MISPMFVKFFNLITVIDGVSPWCGQIGGVVEAIAHVHRGGLLAEECSTLQTLCRHIW